MQRCSRFSLASRLGASLLAGVALSLIAAAPIHAQAPGALPPGEGRDLVAVVCSQCHGLNTIMQIRDGSAGWKRQKTEWDGIVANMVTRGAQATPEERQTIVSYLAAQFGE